MKKGTREGKTGEEIESDDTEINEDIYEEEKSKEKCIGDDFFADDYVDRREDKSGFDLVDGVVVEGENKAGRELSPRL